MTNDNLRFLHTLEGIIRERAHTAAAGSYTAQLLASGRSRMAQKVGEEALELALAAVAGSRGQQLEESADLLYHLLVLLADANLSLTEVIAVLEARHED